MNKSMIRSDKEREARNEVVKMNRLKRAQVTKQQSIKGLYI